jgi:hypothetical protein
MRASVPGAGILHTLHGRCRPMWLTQKEPPLDYASLLQVVVVVSLQSRVVCCCESVREGRHLVPFRIHHRGLFVFSYFSQVDRCKSGLSLFLYVRVCRPVTRDSRLNNPRSLSFPYSARSYLISRLGGILLVCVTRMTIVIAPGIFSV